MISKLTTSLRKFHRDEEGLEALQVVMIIAIAAMVMIAATTGVNVMTLSTGKFIIHLLEQCNHSFVDYIQDPGGPDADP